MLKEDQLLMFYGMCGISQRYLVQGYKQTYLMTKSHLRFVFIVVRVPFCVHAKV